jgi:hypothetical protein
MNVVSNFVKNSIFFSIFGLAGKEMKLLLGGFLAN